MPLALSPQHCFFNIAIKAWIKSQWGCQSAKHAKQILCEMKSPADAVTYSLVIHAWAISSMNMHAAEWAEDILLKIKQDRLVQSNIVVYNACLNAWCKSKSPIVVNWTEALLRWMGALNHVKLDLVSYNMYIHALAMMGKEPMMAQQADDTLHHLKKSALMQMRLIFAPMCSPTTLSLKGGCDHVTQMMPCELVMSCTN